jgi:hypothetical protein
VRAWRVSYSEPEQLSLQNPQLCLSLARIIVQRYETNVSAPPT